jgi:hypothetical protein
MGAILARMARIVTTGERVSRRDRETAPAERGELAGWYSAHLDHAPPENEFESGPETTTGPGFLSSRGYLAYEEVLVSYRVTRPPPS